MRAILSLLLICSSLLFFGCREKVKIRLKVATKDAGVISTETPTTTATPSRPR